MIAPGTWLKWYVTDTGRPIYFRFIGRILVDDAVVDSVILDTQWCRRLSMPEHFLDWLLPLEEGDKPGFIVKRILQSHVNPPLWHPGGGISSPAGQAAYAAVANKEHFPRLFGTAD